MTQEEFANLIGVDRTLISKWQDKIDAFTGMNIQKEVINEHETKKACVSQDTQASPY